MVHAVLTAVLEWANYQPVILASVDCLKIMLHYLNTGAACLLHVCLAGLHSSEADKVPFVYLTRTCLANLFCCSRHSQMLS